jgi:glycosyltransferase involved in cell wall biosynthesis
MESLLDLTAIILTFNEELHIERCIRSAQTVCKRIFVIDSFSSDRTLEIARTLGAEALQHPFTNQASQFQWGLDNLIIDTQWIMRLDADEYLEPGLITEIRQNLPDIPLDMDGIYIKRKVFFMGKWIRHGGFYPHLLLRIWRKGKGRIEQRWMDEHIVLPSTSKTMVFKQHLVDDNHKGITFWTNKHNAYASREMAEILISRYSLLSGDHALRQMSSDPQVRRKRLIKEEYYNKLPPVVRAVLYFFYRYILKLGFLDGGKGFVWHFLQGFWYRLLVDVKVMEVEERGMRDPNKIGEILSHEYGIDL